MTQITILKSDLNIIEYQLQRQSIRFLGVARRCKFANPLIITQDPFFTRGQIFPTFYYLTCPRLVKVISRLESSDFFKNFKRSVNAGGELNSKYLQLIQTYQERLAGYIDSLYSIDPQGFLISRYSLSIKETGPSSVDQNYADNIVKDEKRVPLEMRSGLLKRGLAGSENVNIVKCLHALYSFLLSFDDRDDSGNGAFFRKLITDAAESMFPEDFADIL